MNRRDIDKLVDEEQAFFHASDKPLPVGEVLVSKGSQGHTPEIVDRLRPSGVPRRNDHLFMVRDPDCLDEFGKESAPYLYQVTPVAPVIKSNWDWLQQAMSLGEPKSWHVQAANNYWSGEPGPHCYDEYLTMAFRVDKRVK